MDNNSTDFFDGTGIITPQKSCSQTPVEIDIPTKLSELENDMGFISDKQYQHTDNNYTDEDKAIVASAGDLPQAIKDVKKATAESIEATDISKELSSNPMRIIDGNWWAYNLNTKRYEDTGIKATGDSFVIRRTYPSVQAMEDDFATTDVETGQFVVIDSNIEDPDNSKLYMKAETEWKFITDLSGATGITGLSAYQIAVQHGFEGTEEEWLASLSQDSKDAAKLANEAAANANAVAAALSTLDDQVQAAEEVRQTQEAARESNTAKAISDTNAVKEATDKVRVETEAVKDNAVKATSDAIAATTAAESAAKSANEEAGRASAAADNADEKATLASNAAAAAGLAAGEAVDVAEKATTATTNANSAADSASAAATSAETQSNRAKAYADNPPKIENDNWWVYDETTKAYKDTGIKAKGTVPDISATASMLPTGSTPEVVKTGTDEAPSFEFKLPEGPIGPEGLPGKSPKIQDGTWWVWNTDTQEYENTNIAVSSDYELTKAKVENVLTGDITTHNHDSQYYTEEEVNQKLSTKLEDAPTTGGQYVRQSGQWAEVEIPVVDLSNYLAKDNTTEFTPTGDYNPATKKYVDDTVAAKEIAVDSALSDTSINPVQNKVIKAAIDTKANSSDVATQLSTKVDKVEGNRLITTEEAGKINSALQLANILKGDNIVLEKDVTNNTITISSTAGIQSISWGEIQGTLANQTDLADILKIKLESGDIVKGDGIEISSLNGKVTISATFSGSYNDLTDTPTIPEDVSGRVTTLETDNTANKTAISNLQTEVGKKANSSDVYTKSETYTQSEVDAAIKTATTALYKYKGSVSTFQDLPLTNNTLGDVYNVLKTDVNYAWKSEQSSGTADDWDPLGGTAALASAVEDGLLSKEDFSKLQGIQAGAQVNVIEEVKFADTALPITSKSVNVPEEVHTSEGTKPATKTPLWIDLADSEVTESYTKLESDNKFQAKESGKGLSTNDFTTPLKNKLDGIETGAQVNVKPDFNAAAGSAAEILNKPTIPSKTSELTNDSNYTTKTYVDGEIAKIHQFSILKVDVLPSTGESNILYLVPKVGAEGDVYNEYIWDGSKFELIGNTTIDLSNYYTKEEVNALVPKVTVSTEAPTGGKDGDIWFQMVSNWTV